MPKLSPTLPLESFSKHWPGLTIEEHYIGELISLAIAREEESAFKTAFKKTFGKAPPEPSQLMAVKGGYAIWSSLEQYLILLEGENINADKDIAKKMGPSAYTTLQSDGWASIDIKAKTSKSTALYDVLERFIPLNLRQAPEGFTSRTSAHHIAVIVIKYSETEIQLLTPRSSAGSFLESLIHTAENVLS
ncbi:sarcosine oxidase subunit gamma [Hellea balneolensis]|uniref:sarcosine oxidase subunit gamma n=1 Tax=Hellea balneolensis TaxID=287478 RepID=UPI0004263E7D|nr:hypothetical protein [Hellea balneolensis]